MTRRPRRRLLAVPPESKSDRMSVLVRTGGGVYFQGYDATAPDWFCGHCGRILATHIPEGRILNIWLTCPNCSWLNGFDIDLGWARYVVSELENLSRERVEQLLDDLKDQSTTSEQFLDRNPDVAQGPIGWLARIDLATLLVILTLLYTVYSGERSAQLAGEHVKLAERQLQQQREADRERQRMTPEDVERIAKRLHELQEKVRIKPPPKPPRAQAKR